MNRQMNRAITMAFAGVLLATGAHGQASAQAGSGAGAQASTPAGAQTGTTAGGGASAQANKSGAQASGSGGASSSTATQAGQGSANLASGTAANAVLSQSIDAKKNKPGDPVTARTTEATKSDGKVVIPKGAKLVGHVTEAKARTKGQSESTLGVVFDKAVLKSGEEVPLNMTVQAIGASNAA